MIRKKKKVEHLFYKTCRHLVTFLWVVTVLWFNFIYRPKPGLEFYSRWPLHASLQQRRLRNNDVIAQNWRASTAKIDTRTKHKTSWWANKHGTLQWLTTTQVQKLSGSSAPFPFRSFLSDPAWNITDMEDKCFVFINNNRNIEIIFTFNI